MQKRILIIRQDRIGDTVLATALPREIKRTWPRSRVTMLVRSYTRPIFENNPYVDEILTDDFVASERQASFWRMVGRLRRRRFTHALMLLPQARYNYMTFCAGIPWRIGHGIILFHALTFVRPVMTRKFRPGRSEAEYAMDLARAMGVRTRDVWSEIHLTDGERARSVANRDHWREGGRRVVGLHVTSGNSAPNWTPAAWGELVQRLAAETSLRVVVTDNIVPAEVAGVPGVLYPNAGVELREALVNLAALHLLVSASTGPMHLAAALQVPTLSLFCPLPACAPALWGPVGNRAEFVLPAAAYCRDACPGDPKRCTYAGCAEVSPEAVAQLVLNSSGSS